MARDDQPEDEMLIEYLLGVLPSDAVEQLDERSIADDEFAVRLSELENDLIDRYVTGRLEKDAVARFETRYLSSAVGRRKIQIAEALRSLPPAEPRVPQPREARAPLIFSFGLLPAMRGAGHIATMVVPRGVEHVRWTLTDVDDCPRYTVVVTDLSTDRVIWQHDDLRAEAGAEGRTVQVTLLATSLEPCTYAIELSGISASGSVGPINSYPVRVVFE